MTTATTFWSVATALAEAHRLARQHARSYYVFALPSADLGHTCTRYGVGPQSYTPGTLPVARVDAYLEAEEGYTCTDAPDYRAPLEG